MADEGHLYYGGDKCWLEGEKEGTVTTHTFTYNRVPNSSLENCASFNLNISKNIVSCLHFWKDGGDRVLFRALITGTRCHLITTSNLILAAITEKRRSAFSLKSCTSRPASFLTSFFKDCNSSITINWCIVK